ncbi:hypothetical protein F4604DRAFT_1879008 [Suillus subluteus]|nr:hypothetical protein F4604DRAFT_1879008 [Suillus subluteus]
MAVWRPKRPRHAGPSSHFHSDHPPPLTPTDSQPMTIICEPWMDQSHPHSPSGADPPDIDPFITDEPLFSDFLYEPDGPINLPHPHLSGLQKKQNQWWRWSQEVVPSLIKPYLAYCRRSESLQSNPDLGLLTGDNLRCSLQVITISCCECCPAPLQLMTRGLFACAPITPSLAVDIQVLELVKNLFVRMTPNSTAWCDALENFLNERGYKLNTKDSLRCRFSNVYHWYTVLTIMSLDYLTTFISNSRCAGADSVASHETPGIPQVLSQPSTYLSSHCPLCFGGSNWQQHCDPDTTVDCIVCIDACFTQKRSNNPRNGIMQDPPNPTATVFIPERDVKVMEDHVNDCRGEVPDGYEDGMRIPVSVLDGCSKSFVAADEKREKASTCFFADTGLMVLLCRHDRVLWLVNMTSAGEKQYYSLALVKRLFKHLPPNMLVGLLYDIGCQLEHSCRKWGLLDDSIISRISFGISVFHAYGHQWPCQIVYHPRKRVGFGLSDGEGCERLWSALKYLIPVLRVSGYHQRLFVLDVQVRYLVLKSFDASGQWLVRKWMLCQKKKQAALDGLRDLRSDEDILREEWAAQVAHQTKPIARQSKHKGAEAIVGVLALEKTLESHQNIVHELEHRLISNNVDDITTFNLQLHDARARCAKVIETLGWRRTALGVSEYADLQKLKKNVYLQLEKLERSYRNTVNELNMRNHTEASIKRREPTILKIVSTYNNLCDQLHVLIHQRKAPANAVPPIPISRDGIFQLDVDDDIWQDVGLEDETADPPRWLADDNVRQGICLLLDLDRCLEEEDRLRCERRVMQECMILEWTALQEAREVADVDVAWHLQKRAAQLSLMCFEWQSRVRPIPTAWEMPDSWGPSSTDIAHAGHSLYHAKTAQAVHADSWELSEDENNDDDVDEGGVDDELMAAVEEVAYANEYHIVDSDSEVEDWDEVHVPSSPTLY